MPFDVSRGRVATPFRVVSTEVLMSARAASFAAAGAVALCTMIAAAQQPFASLADDHDIVQRFLTSDEVSPTAYQAGKARKAAREQPEEIAA